MIACRRLHTKQADQTKGRVWLYTTRKTKCFDVPYLFCHIQALKTKDAGAVVAAEELVRDTILQHLTINPDTIFQHLPINQGNQSCHAEKG